MARMPLPVPWIDDAEPLPPSAQALGPDSAAPGLLAAGGGLGTQRLEAAYRQGAFPWFSEGQPVLWWSPQPRMVLQTANFKLHRSMRKTLQRFLRTPGCELRIDHAFERVIQACADTPRNGQHGTWIVPPMVAAYTAWHHAGQVHSFETWVDGALVGGLYGVCIGRMFFGESMFAWRTDASKLALACLVGFCRQHGIAWIDCQQNTEHLAHMGAHEVARPAFEAHLALSLGEPEPQAWIYDPCIWSHLGVALPEEAS